MDQRTSGADALTQTNDRTPALLGVVCGLSAALFWALGFAGTRHGLKVGFTPVDLLVHRYVWSGIAFLPLVLRAGISDLCGIGWGRGLALMVLGGPVMSLISYTGFLFVPLGHGSVIQPSCATLGGLLLAALFLKERISVSRLTGAIVIVGGLGVIGAESIGHIGIDGVQGDLIFVLTGLMFAGFGALLRHWRVSAVSAALVINVLSLLLLPIYIATVGPAHIAAIGLTENAIQALAQGVLAGPAALYLFAVSVQRLGVARAAVFPACVPALTLLTGWLLLGEPPTMLQAAGLVIVLCGFYLAQRQR
ncbi:DMT family transporter [Bradyrhizobium sp. WYCCWR 13023]|uniref:DMT family transporter n=1 Tax=Bradyrhizobium zhengyangense TaxID=2911009 RepID=A0A9X1UC99_9BRAD|nr:MULTISPECIES: DMT family transporter [Bradyrhizobium]MCG2632116.1 DMT family transporter [Bradyrhizobium zhengyangense]MCG2637692.1 DMT family transporter [Bradyrhizobium zhengyangense]MCG2666088.1 DMT family transporter [Bradyrhizobium zhengyangense]MDA9521112.1 permease [Bradyrhizobium sp. CCBAU 11434]